MLSAPSLSSYARDLSRKFIDNPAYGLFVAFLIPIFFLKGGLANSIAIACFAASWILIARGSDRSDFPTPLIAPIIVAFLIAIGLRLVLPPYGSDEAIPGTGLSRALLILGLYGLILFTQSRLRFSEMLWLIASAAFICVVVSLLATPQSTDRLILVGRTENPILAAGAITTGLFAAITLLAYHTDIRRAPLKAILLAVMICSILAGVYLANSRGPLLALISALCLTPLVIFYGSRKLLYICASGAYGLVTAAVLLSRPIQNLLCPTIELACRDPSRSDVWLQSLRSIAHHPFWGVGYDFRFDGIIPHAHNTYLGTALHYGIPLAIFFVGVVAVALSKAFTLKSRDEKFFILAMLLFANGFMASDLSEPLRFFNTHYLFLWFPILLAMMRPQAETPEDGNFNKTE